ERGLTNLAAIFARHVVANVELTIHRQRVQLAVERTVVVDEGHSNLVPELPVALAGNHVNHFHLRLVHLLLSFPRKDAVTARPHPGRKANRVPGGLRPAGRRNAESSRLARRGRTTGAGAQADVHAALAWAHRTAAYSGSWPPRSNANSWCNPVGHSPLGEHVSYRATSAAAASCPSACARVKGRPG